MGLSRGIITVSATTEPIAASPDSGVVETVQSITESFPTGLKENNVSLHNMTTSDAQMLHKKYSHILNSYKLVLFTGTLKLFIFWEIC